MEGESDFKLHYLWKPKSKFMKVLLDIKDSRVDFIMELLKGFSSYVKAKPISQAKSGLLEDLTEAASDVRLHKQGKLKLKSAQELLHEL
jgi:hypothetical protein